MKKFFSTITLQVRGAEKHLYADTAGKTTKRVKTAFPIIQLISDVVEEGEQISLVTVVVGGPEGNPNYHSFVQELEALKAQRGFTYLMECIHKDSNEHIDSIVGLFGDIISHVEDDDRLYACVTYGTKPMSTVMTMALHYAYRLKENIVVDTVVYGQKNWKATEEPVCELYDTTALFYIDCLIDRIANMKVAEPEALLKSLIGMRNS